MIISKNPYTGEEISRHKELAREEIESALEAAHQRFDSWKKTPLKDRFHLLLKAAKGLRDNKKEYAEMITREMGKPISQSISEIEKCAWVCEYYAENAEEQLARETIETDAYKSYVSYEPLGVVLAVMP